MTRAILIFCLGFLLLLIFVAFACPILTAIHALRKPRYSTLGMFLLLCVFLQLIAPGVVVFLIRNDTIHIEEVTSIHSRDPLAEFALAVQYVGAAFLASTAISWLFMVGLLIGMRRDRHKQEICHERF